MSKTYTVTLSEAEAKALAVVAVDPQDWIENVVKSRCSISIDDIVNAEVQRKLAAGEPISGSKEDIVNAANVETAAVRQARQDAERAAMEALNTSAAQ